MSLPDLIVTEVARPIYSGAATAQPSSPSDHRRETVRRLLLGESPLMRRLVDTVVRLAPADIPVLLVGPTGAGKELVARALHAASGRTGQMVAVNTCAVPETMFESTLFGHVKGAFTGALRDTPGMLTEANGGTLFLDEISGLPLPSQAKLLRAIEGGGYRPVGATRDRDSRFRVVAASNEELSQRVDAGVFRADLFHRLGGFIVHVPGLAERLEDLELLVRHFLAKCGRGSSERLASGVVEALASHPWPGNVRELRNVVERMVVLTGPGHAVTRGVAEQAVAHMPVARTALSPRRDGSPRDRGHAELLVACEECAGDAARVAAVLGVSRATVYRRLKRAGLDMRTLVERADTPPS